KLLIAKLHASAGRQKENPGEKHQDRCNHRRSPRALHRPVEPQANARRQEQDEKRVVPTAAIGIQSCYTENASKNQPAGEVPPKRRTVQERRVLWFISKQRDQPQHKQQEQNPGYHRLGKEVVEDQESRSA